MRFLSLKIKSTLVRLPLIIASIIVINWLIFSVTYTLQYYKKLSYDGWKNGVYKYLLFIKPSVTNIFNLKPFENIDRIVFDYADKNDLDGFVTWSKTQAKEYPLIHSCFIWQRGQDAMTIIPVKTSPSDSGVSAIKEYLDFRMLPDNQDKYGLDYHPMRTDFFEKANNFYGFDCYHNSNTTIHSYHTIHDNSKQVFGIIWDEQYYRDVILQQCVKKLQENYRFLDESIRYIGPSFSYLRNPYLGGIHITDSSGDTLIRLGEMNEIKELMLGKHIDVNSSANNQMTRLPNWHLYLHVWNENDYYISQMVKQEIWQKPFWRNYWETYTKIFIIAFFSVSIFFYYITVNIVARNRQQKFIAHISHELRTPVTKIRLFAETLKTERTASPEKEEEYLDTILRESDHMSVLVDNTLNLARLDSDKLKYHKQPIRTSIWLKKFIDSQLPFLYGSGFAVKLDIPADLPQIKVDSEALQLALRNLIDNAIKYSEEKKEITFKAGMENNKLLISLEDKGIGVPANKRRKIFKRFYRIKPKDRQQVGGVGVGLSLVKEIISAHRGKTICESGVGGIGSKFIISLSA